MKLAHKGTFLLILAAIFNALFLTACTKHANAAGDDSKHTLISWGWNNPDTQYIRDHWKEMEQSPIQGTAIKIPLDYSKPTTGDGSSGNLLSWHVFGDQAFDLRNFQQAITDLQTAHWRKFQLFLPVAVASLDQDRQFNWFDDKRWKIIENNWRVLLQIAKRGGCRGIIFDPEIYDYSQYGAELFSYQDQKTKRVDKPFDEYERQVRRRGQSLMQIAAQEYPDITILASFTYTPALTGSNTLSERRYALLPSLMDGMLEASSPLTKWVDTWEYSYGYKDRAQFLQAYRDITHTQLSLCAVPDIFHARVRAGFSLFPDNTAQHAGWNESDFSSNYFTPTSFEQSLQQALEISDGYVLLYSQKPGFFPEQHLPAAYRKAIETALASANSS